MTKCSVPRIKPIASIPATRSIASLWNGLRRSVTQSDKAWGWGTDEQNEQVQRKNNNNNPVIKLMTGHSKAVLFIYLYPAFRD